MNDDVTVQVRRSGLRFEAEAVLEIGADVQTMWDTIADCDALPRFMPGIRKCRVVERRPLGVWAAEGVEASSASIGSRSR